MPVQLGRPVLSIALSIGLFLAILIVVNLPAGLIGLEFGDGVDRVWFAPPGYVIPIVWIVLFALYGVARALLVRAGEVDGLWLLYALAFLCAAYVYYTIGMGRVTGISPLWFGLAGNLTVIVVAATTAFVLHQRVPVAGLLVAPTIVWTAFATLIILAELRQAKML